MGVEDGKANVGAADALGDAAGGDIFLARARSGTFFALATSLITSA